MHVDIAQTLNYMAFDIHCMWEKIGVVNMVDRKPFANFTYLPT